MTTKEETNSALQVRVDKSIYACEHFAAWLCNIKTLFPFDLAIDCETFFFVPIAVKL